MRVFISYAREDAEAGEAISTQLRQEGHDVFLDQEELKIAEAFNEPIRDAIDAADVVVFLLTPESIDKNRYARLELEMAAQRWPDASARLLVVPLRPVEIGSLPSYLRSVSIHEPVGDLGAWVAHQLAEMATAQERLAVRFLEGARRRRWTLALGAALVLLPCVVLLLLRLGPTWPEETTYAALAAVLAALAGFGLAFLLVRRGTSRSVARLAAALAAVAGAVLVVYVVDLSSNTATVGETRVLELGLDEDVLQPAVYEQLQRDVSEGFFDSLQEAYKIYRWGSLPQPQPEELWRPERVRGTRVRLLLEWMLVYLLLGAGSGLLTVRPGRREAGA